MVILVTEPKIRSAKRSDLPDIVRIYNHYVRETHVTFDTHEFAEQQRLAWFEAFSESGPYRLLAAELSGRVAGYASSRPFHQRPAYSQSVETSIYLDPLLTGRGIGRLLYGRLFAFLESESAVHRAYAGVALPNPESIALHERMGFQLAGTFREVGFKFGKYLDVAWYQKNFSNSHVA